MNYYSEYNVNNAQPKYKEHDLNCNLNAVRGQLRPDGNGHVCTAAHSSQLASAPAHSSQLASAPAHSSQLASAPPLYQCSPALAQCDAPLLPIHRPETSKSAEPNTAKEAERAEATPSYQHWIWVILIILLVIIGLVYLFS